MQGIGRILVPIDFSEPSRKALRYALSLGVESDGSLLLVHVVPFVPPLPYAHPFEGRKLEDSDREGVASRLRELVDSDLYGAIETEAIVRSGDIQDELLAVAKERDVDLIVMGTHGRRRFERWLLGSVAESILRKSAVPVLTVSHLDADHDLGKPGPVPLKKILVATDLMGGDDAVSRTMDWARELSAEVLILHVVSPLRLALTPVNVALDSRVDMDAIRRGAVARLRETIPAATREDPRVRTEVKEGVPYEVILATADEEKADLIVLNTSSRPGLDRALLGSTAERVLRAAHVPVLSFPPPGSAHAGGSAKGSSGSILI